MRKKEDIQRFVDMVISDLISFRKKGYSWSDGTVNYLLGQAVAFQIVLNPEMTWSDANEMITTRVERALIQAE